MTLTMIFALSCHLLVWTNIPSKFEGPSPKHCKLSSFFVPKVMVTLIFSFCDLDVQWTGTICIILKDDQPRIIPVKFGQVNPISGLGDVI